MRIILITICMALAFMQNHEETSLQCPGRDRHKTQTPRSHPLTLRRGMGAKMGEMGDGGWECSQHIFRMNGWEWNAIILFIFYQY